jgi:hypothetical protein
MVIILHKDGSIKKIIIKKMNFENINSIDSPLHPSMLKRKRLSAVSYYKKMVNTLEIKNAEQEERINVMKYKFEMRLGELVLYTQKLEKKLNLKYGPEYYALEANFDEMKLKFEQSEERNCELQEKINEMEETNEEMVETRRQLNKRIEYLLKK